MDKKLKGDISETAVLFKLTQLGYGVSLPYGDRLPYDLIVDNGQKLLKIQVKTAYLNSAGGVDCAGPRSTLTNRVNIKYKKYKSIDFDFMISFFPDDASFYIVPSDIYCKFGSTFRIKPAGTQRLLKIDANKFLENWNQLTCGEIR